MNPLTIVCQLQMSTSATVSVFQSAYLCPAGPARKLLYNLPTSTADQLADLTAVSSLGSARGGYS